MVDKKNSLALVKFLLPRVDITGKLKLKDFNSMKNEKVHCVARGDCAGNDLGQAHGGGSAEKTRSVEGRG